MGFFRNLFKKTEATEEFEGLEWDSLHEGHNGLNMKDPAIREQYVLSCLEQMSEASKELDRYTDEYDMVTSKLTDMEEIEAITGADRKNLESVARHIKELRKTHDEYVTTPSLISEHEYHKMEAIASEIESAIQKLKDAEDMREKIKSDLSRIDKEKSAYEYRKREVATTIENSRGVATIALVAGVVLIVVLFALQLLLDLKVMPFYYITVGILAISVTIIYVRYADAVSERKRIELTINELILLENKVKIRYINNKSLVDYLYTKYDTDSSDKLKAIYEKYLLEKEQKRKFERNEVVYEDELTKLIRILRNYRIKSPEIWVHQTDALYDKREMVEIRHGLIASRQKLRKQMEYNEQIALEASNEIKSIIKDYPEYSDSVLNLVNAYENKK